MSSRFSGGSLPPGGFDDKTQQIGQHGQYVFAGFGPDRLATGLQGPIFHGLAEGFQHLTLYCASCASCLNPCDVSNSGYQPISGPGGNELDYGTTDNRPYEAEKPPSAQVPQPDVYVPTTIAPNEPGAFPVGDPALMSAYVPNYQPLQESSNQAMGVQPAVVDTVIYPAEVPTSHYYPQITRAPASEESLNYSNTIEHPLNPGEVISDPYHGTMMGMAMSPALHQAATIPVTTAGFNIDPTYAIPCVKSEELEAPLANTSLDVVFPNQRPPASKRGPFKDAKAREETAATRKNGSCIRCKMQRVRCRLDPDNPKGPCMGCKPKANSTHHKPIIRQPCVRHKITDCHFFKRRQVLGYEWTNRWVTGIAGNINNWASNEVRVIRLWEGYTPSDMFVEVPVRQFVPQPGDKLDRTWVTQNGDKRSVAIPTYAITDLDEVETAYEDYIKRGVGLCFDSVVKRVMGVRDHLIYSTYLKAWELSQDPRTAPDERELLLQTLQLWMAVRLTTKSVEIVGEETLGMSHDILDSSSPQHGSIPLPPVMGAQLDLVLIQHIQTRLRREMLEKLQKMTLQNKQKTWLTTYLVTFMLLHNIALVTDHDASYARKHGMKTKFARESDVQEYHTGGTILLAYFHYCNKGIFPFSEECRDQDLRTLAQLDDQAVQFIHWTRSQAMAHKHEWEELHQANQYDQPYFFVSQLFQRDWQPQTWTC